MPRIETIQCPVCGAPVQGAPDRCAYCGATLVIPTGLAPLDPATFNRALINDRIAEFRARVRANPNDEAAHYGLGLAYQTLGLHEDAAAQLTEAARLMPEHPHIQRQLAAAWFGLAVRGHHLAAERAATAIGKAIVLQPRDPEIAVLAAQIDLRRGKPLAVLRILRPLVGDGLPFAHVKPLLTGALASLVPQLTAAPLHERRRWQPDDRPDPSQGRAWLEMSLAAAANLLWLGLAPWLDALGSGVALAVWLLVLLPLLGWMIHRLLHVQTRNQASRSRRADRLRRELTAATWSESQTLAAADYLLSRPAN